eukprot:TRINITY_DN68976_c0_g1_i1.p2 TRINITY_DN68976_c0_g1~~TRINITY_DN68976_c0_g1_i1.p2  ORF type:complete len:100 (-),score=10.34 TRINITY_DN68976_c0_g1_i1:29-286(-)
MHASHRSYHMTRVAGLTNAGTSGDQEFSVHSERNVQGVTILAGDPRPAPVQEFIQKGITTLMLTDLPYKLTLADLRDELEVLGFE